MQEIINMILQIPLSIMQPVCYILLFVFETAESIPLLWFLMPGQNAVLVAGVLAQMKVLSLPIVLILICVSGWLWDIIAYNLWSKYWLNFLKRYEKWIKISDKIITKIEWILKKRLAVGVFLSKFYWRTRWILPFMAGYLKIPKKKTLTYALISNICFGIVRVSIGYFVGTSYDIIAPKIGKFLTMWVVIIIVIIALVRYLRNDNIFVKKTFSLAVIWNLAAIIGFCVLAQRLYTNKISFIRLDSWIQGLFEHSDIVNTISLCIDKIFSVWFIGRIGLIIIVYLYRKKLMQKLTIFLSTMISWLFLFPFIKILIQRPRPLSALIPLHDYSFPSWHACMSCVVGLIVRYVLKDQFKTAKAKICFLFLIICGILIVWTSRILLHVHWFTDLIWWLLLWYVIVVTNILLRKFFFNDYLDVHRLIRRHYSQQLIDVLAG